MNEWTATRHSGSKCQEQRMVSDSLGHPMEQYLSSWRYHCRRGLLQQYEQLLEDMVGPGEARDLQLDRTRMAKALTGDRNFSIPCELGVRYPTLRAMINREDLQLRKSVRFHFNGYVYEILSICCVYTIHILTKIF